MRNFNTLLILISLASLLTTHPAFSQGKGQGDL